MIRNIVVLGSVVFACGAMAVAPASAAGEHCHVQGRYCLFSGTNYTGIQAVLPTACGCHAVSGVGFPVAHSAARGFGDGSALQLYSDSTCTTSLGTVAADVPNTSAASYRLLPIPG